MSNQAYFRLAESGDSAPVAETVPVGGGFEATLPELRGSPEQVKWARSIRTRALTGGEWTWQRLSLLVCTVDATWWLANRTQLEFSSVKLPDVRQLLAGVWPPGVDRPATNMTDR